MNRPIAFSGPNKTQAADGLPRRAFVLDEIDAMMTAGILSPHERIELIAGEIVRTSPKGAWHETVKAELNTHLARTAGPSVRIAPEVWLRLDPHHAVEPDLVIRRHWTEPRDVGPSDVLLAIEIADSSLPWDLGRKIEIYAAFGIPEVWVVNARTLVTRVHRGPGEAGYAAVRDAGPDETIVPLLVPELAVTLSAFGLSPEAAAAEEDRAE